MYALGGSRPSVSSALMLLAFKVCRQCGGEYRPEIERCADCGGELEARYDDGHGGVMPARAPAPGHAATAGELGEPSADRLPQGESTVYSGRAAADLKPLAERLIEVEIPFRFVCHRPTSATAPARFELLVGNDNRAHAFEVVAPLLDADPEALVAVERAFDAEAGYRSCPACGQTLTSGAAQCPACALALRAEARTCKWCGELVEPDAERCPRCGRSA
jgi:RNA polymerase subunit RPABC4/transcription elongation factor Spt4